MFKFNKVYFFISIIIFIIEVMIALYVRDSFIRPYFGDVLAAILVYCLLRSFTHLGMISAAVLALLISYAIEISQYIQLIKYIGLEHSSVARIILGSSFEWLDMLAYTVGIAFVVFIERRLSATQA